MKKYLLILPLFGFIILSCGKKSGSGKTENPDTTKAPAPNVDSLAFETDTFHVNEKGKNCEGKEGGCGYCDIYYEKIKTPLSPVHDSVNVFIDSLMAHSFDKLRFKDGKADIQTAALNFIKDSEDPDYADMPGGWFWEYAIRIYRPVREIFTVTCSNSDYSGGAHPNSFYEIHNFFTATGKRVLITDIFKDTAALNNMAVKLFKKAVDVPDDMDLMDAGYFVSDADFGLNDNMDITTESITWEFNAYEIGPYAMGPSSLKIPMKDLEKYMKIKFTEVEIK